MNAALGGVSAGGLGTPLFDVTQRGGGPNAFVANQSTGNAGGVTLSKFSLDVPRDQHPGHLPLLCPKVGPIATTAAINKSKQRTFRNRIAVNVRFRLVIIDHWQVFTIGPALTRLRCFYPNTHTMSIFTCTC
jgi:hypothetical protein